MNAKLPIIGHDLMLIRGFAKKVHKAIPREIKYLTDLRETDRGYTFEAILADSRIARVTIELDRVAPDEAAAERA